MWYDLESFGKLLEEAGFQILKNVYHRKCIRNVKRDLTMKRVWLYAKAQKPFNSSGSATDPAITAAAAIAGVSSDAKSEPAAVVTLAASGTSNSQTGDTMTST